MDSRCSSCRANSPPSTRRSSWTSPPKGLPPAHRTFHGCANCTRGWNCERCSRHWVRYPSRRCRQGVRRRSMSSWRKPRGPMPCRRWRLSKRLPLHENPAKPKLGHHLKNDARSLANYGIALQGQRFDSMLESYVLNSVATRHDMDAAAAKYLGVKTIAYEEVAGKGAKQITFNQVDVDRAAEYSAEDADVTLRLHLALWPQIEALPTLKAVYETIEQPLVSVLYRMERKGVLVDRDLLKIQSSELAARMLELQAQAHAEAGGAFNLDSPKQLQEILFGKLGIPVIRKTPTGQPSTAEDVLEELAATYPLPKLILEYRGVAKLKSTYTDTLPEQINRTNGRIHTSYHQAVAATGRLSSTDPNLQNIPIRTKEGRRIRQAFV